MRRPGERRQSGAVQPREVPELTSLPRVDVAKVAVAEEVIDECRPRGVILDELLPSVDMVMVGVVLVVRVEPRFE